MMGEKSWEPRIEKEKRRYSIRTAKDPRWGRGKSRYQNKDSGCSLKTNIEERLSEEMKQKLMRIIEG